MNDNYAYVLIQLWFVVGFVLNENNECSIYNIDTRK